MVKRAHVLIIAVLLIAGAWMMTLPASFGTRVPDHAFQDVQTETEYWKSRIADAGGKKAYAEFVGWIERGAVDQDQIHTLAHIFGGALYRVEGIRGLTACDARFTYGCFHEFLGEAIAEGGLSVVRDLNEECATALVESPLSCQHGIGHGLTATLGYDEDSFKQAMAVCRELPYNDPIGGCYGGVFMEYNLRTILSIRGEVADIRPLTDGNYYDLCEILSTDLLRPCFFWQPQWWHQLFRVAGESDEEIIFTRLGALCSEATADPAFSRACFEGIGNITTPAANFDARRAAELCDLTSDHPSRRLFCRAIAANSLYVGGAGPPGDGEAVCEGLSETGRAYCEAYARNEANILRTLPPPETL